MRKQGHSKAKLRGTTMSSLTGKNGTVTRNTINNDAVVSSFFQDGDIIVMLVREVANYDPQYSPLVKPTAWEHSSTSIHVFSDCGDFVLDVDVSDSMTIGSLASQIEEKYKASIREDTLNKLTVHRLYVFEKSGCGRLDLNAIDKSILAKELIEEESLISFQFIRDPSSVKILNSFPADYVESQMRVIVQFDEDIVVDPLIAQLQQEMKLGQITKQQAELTFYESNSFQVESKIILTDPSYKKSDKASFLSSNITLNSVVTGNWKAATQVHLSSNRLATLYCFHDSVTPTTSSESWESVGQAVVDSTYFSVFDLDRFVAGENERDSPGKYSAAKSNTGLAFYNHGVICKAGYGDGFYSCYVIYDPLSKNVVQIKVVFIGEEEEEKAPKSSALQVNHPDCKQQ